MEKNNFRPMCNKNGRFEGIQGFDKNGEIIVGGNVIHQYVFWDITENEANELLAKSRKKFPQYEFKLTKI